MSATTTGSTGARSSTSCRSRPTGTSTAASCGGSWQIAPDEAEAIATLFDDRRSFAVDRSHVTITGRCSTCTAAEAALAD